MFNNLDSETANSLRMFPQSHVESMRAISDSRSCLLDNSLLGQDKLVIIATIEEKIANLNNCRTRQLAEQAVYSLQQPTISLN